MSEENTAQNCFVLTSNGTIPRDRKISYIFLVSLVAIGLSSITRIIMMQELGDVPNSSQPSMIENILDGLIPVFFHLILYLILQLAYPENSTHKVRLQVGYAAQIWLLADLLFIIAVILGYLPGTVLNIGLAEELYYVIWPLATIWSLFYIGKPITERLEESFDDWSMIILATIVLSAIIYWISYGLTEVLRLLVLLPFGGV